MKKTALLVALSLTAIGCAADGRHPNVGVGVQIGGNAPPPVVASPPPQGGGPPPWAPAHGRRAKAVVYRYYYYPSTGVYFNVSTGSYFYLNGGSWQVSMSLPSSVVIDANDYVSVELDTDRPYVYYEEHKVKYKGKGHSHGKGHGHKKGHWKKGGPPF